MLRCRLKILGNLPVLTGCGCFGGYLALRVMSRSFQATRTGLTGTYRPSRSGFPYAYTRIRALIATMGWVVGPFLHEPLKTLAYATDIKL